MNSAAAALTWLCCSRIWGSIAYGRTFTDAMTSRPTFSGYVTAVRSATPPPSHYVEVFKLLDGGLRDGGWMGENRPEGGHALAILPGLTHYDIFSSPLFAATVLAFLDQPGQPVD